MIRNVSKDIGSCKVDVCVLLRDRDKEFILPIFCNNHNGRYNKTFYVNSKRPKSIVPLHLRL